MKLCFDYGRTEDTVDVVHGLSDAVSGEDVLVTIA